MRAGQANFSCEFIISMGFGYAFTKFFFSILSVVYYHPVTLEPPFICLKTLQTAWHWFPLNYLCQRRLQYAIWTVFREYKNWVELTTSRWFYRAWNWKHKFRAAGNKYAYASDLCSRFSSTAKMWKKLLIQKCETLARHKVVKSRWLTL